jgi:hypothetical protein
MQDISQSTIKTKVTAVPSAAELWQPHLVFILYTDELPALYSQCASRSITVGTVRCLLLGSGMLREPDSPWVELEC